MGQDEHKLGVGSMENLQNRNITRNYFDFLYIIGKGGFGKVCLNNNKIIYFIINRYGK